MHQGAKNPLIAITSFLLIATSSSFSAAVDTPPSQDGSSNALLPALYLAEDASKGLVLVPGLLDASSQEPSHQGISHLEYQPPSRHDPYRLIIDDSKLSPQRARVPATWQASVDLLAASRLDEDVWIDGQELGTGINTGARARLTRRSNTPGEVLNAWDVIAIGLIGEDSLYQDPNLFLVPDPYHYKASFVSVESNAIHRTEYKRRVREQFLGVRYMDQGDAIETAASLFGSPPLRQEAHNRMVGLQAGLEQSWSSWARLRFAWGVKAGVFYSSVDQDGYVYNGTANTFPLLLDSHADLAFRIFEQAYLGIGINGIRLDDQYQSRFAWQAPESTHPVTILGMRWGFDYAY